MQDPRPPTDKCLPDATKANLGTSDKLSVYIPLRHGQHPETRARRWNEVVCMCVSGLIPQELKWTVLFQWYATILGKEVKTT